MKDVDLAWAVEEACLNAWPAPRELLLGGFLLRAAGGPSRRINSASPLRGGQHDVPALLDAAGRIYGALGRPVIVRVPALLPMLGAALERQGYRPQAETCTLFAPLPGPGVPGEAAVEGAPAPDEGWLALRARLNGDVPEADATVRAVIGSLLLPRLFVSARNPGGTVAAAFGVIDRGLLVIEAVGTAPEARRQGHARRLVGRLMAWAAGQGAHGACLQVLADNTPARLLYAALGFNTDLYRYAYHARERVG